MTVYVHSNYISNLFHQLNDTLLKNGDGNGESTNCQ